MLLENKVAVVYGGGGVIGGAIARGFAREGARVGLVGRSREKLDAVARDIAAGGVHVATVDVLDEGAVEAHLSSFVAEAGRVDVVVNAVGIRHVQGTPLMDLSLADFERPIHDYLRAQFVVAKAATRFMSAQRSGVLLGLSTPAARVGFAGVLGFGTACGAIETFHRHLAVEAGASGVRVVCLRPDAVPETVKLGSHARDVFGAVADRMGLTLDDLLAPETNKGALKRYPRLSEVVNAAVFAASDGGGAMTGAIMNLTCGSVLD